MEKGQNGAGIRAGAPARPLSPHISIYRWPITMVASIVHRATGMALAVGTVFLAWWLLAAAQGPDAYAAFTMVAAHPVGQFILYGFVWSLAFHLLNGIRHLIWDLGFGFKVADAKLTALLTIIFSFLIAAAIIGIGWMVKGGLGV
jgi:succinate dehydrogenase / fumarate reductase cytochrome b subunit